MTPTLGLFSSSVNFSGHVLYIDKSNVGPDLGSGNSTFEEFLLFV